jgi:hypothetical protein
MRETPWLPQLSVDLHFTRSACVSFFSSDGMTDCSDSECCSHSTCTDHIMCLSSNDPVEVLLRKQPTVGDGVLLPARQVPDRGELGAVLLPHGRIHGEVSGRRWRSVSSDVLELTSRKSSHADRSNAAHRKSALHVESEVGGHSLAAYARAPHTPSGAPSLPSDTPSARGPRGAPGPHLCLVLSESLCASPRLRSPSLSLRLRTNRVRDSARFLCTPPPRPSLISF